MTPPEDNVVQRELRIAARPETIFAYFTDPTKMIQWMGSKAILDPQPGGIYHVIFSDHYAARGEYLEIIPYRRIVFSLGYEGQGSQFPPGSTIIEITLTPDSDGTIMLFRHLGLPTDKATGQERGWDHYLSRLLAAAEGRIPGQDPWTLLTADQADSQLS